MKTLSKWLKKYFMPHRENDGKLYFFQYESVFALATLIVIVELAFLAQVFIVFDKTNFLAAILPGVLTNLTNEQRGESSLPPLVENELLTKAAQLKAEDMAMHGYFAHTSPAGKTPWYWFTKVGYRFSQAGENLAVNFFESSDVAKAWMNSPTHYANIVKKDFTEIGIGVASGIYKGKNTVFVAQLFGTPINGKTDTSKPSKSAPKVVPKTKNPVSAKRIAIAPTSTQILG